jgi:excisionase family DNA binding protein
MDEKSRLADSMAYPPRAMRADRAAAYLSLSRATFLKWVDDGRLPKPKRLGGVVFWDRLALDAFVEHYEGEDKPNDIDELLGIKHGQDYRG